MPPTIPEVYELLYSAYGPQDWWPADSPFEVIVGALLTQQTTWASVEKAIANLELAGLLDIHSLARADVGQVEELVRPTGFYRQKAGRIIGVTRYLADRYNGDLDAFFDRDTQVVRAELLSLEGIGPETADSIMLYAGDKPVFVVDAYTHRLFARLGIVEGLSYHGMQTLVQLALPLDVRLFNEYHALVVAHAKRHCRSKPRCEGCPLLDACGYAADES